ncbi:3-Oxoacyl-[acyl-carrier-protein (ACP)] synthase III [Fragilaria crotonensis]|nr:3-Oxoacyl-[acyl-carrier-protein (ACP)] synthase III [Fragilaria crotonensis]
MVLTQDLETSGVLGYAAHSNGEGHEDLTCPGMTVDDVDWLLLHQANIRIMEAVATRLGIPMEKVIANLGDYGNTSAASIPLALDEAVRSVRSSQEMSLPVLDLELDCRGVLPF